MFFIKKLIDIIIDNTCIQGWNNALLAQSLYLGSILSNLVIKSLAKVEKGNTSGLKSISNFYTFYIFHTLMA